MKKTFAIILSVLMIMVIGCTKDNGTLKQKENTKEGVSASTGVINEGESDLDVATIESTTSTESTTTTEPNSPEFTGDNSWSKDYD